MLKIKVFACRDIGGPHPFHQDPARKLTEKEIEKMRLKAQKLKAHLEKVEK